MKALPWIFAGVAISAAVYFIANQPEYGYSTGSRDVDAAANKASTWGTRQRVTGTGTSVVGKLKEAAGNATGNDELAGKGLVDQAAGAVKDTAGKAAHAVSDTIKDLNR